MYQKQHAVGDVVTEDSGVKALPLEALTIGRHWRPLSRTFTKIGHIATVEGVRR